MPVPASIQETYRERLEIADCYTFVSEVTQQLLDQDVRRYGIHSIHKVAHGVLAFCLDNDTPLCLPWLVAPDAPAHDIIGGRHGFVTQEFFPIADDANLRSYTKGASATIRVEDFIGTYVVNDPANEVLYTVICDSADTSEATTGHIELVKDFSRKMTDHQVLIGAGGAEAPRSFLKIKDGVGIELPYGFQRGLKRDTIAEPDDIMGKARELENYASYAQKHGLDQWEYSELAHYAVKAFREGRQVSLDELCEQILTEREENPDDNA